MAHESFREKIIFPSALVPGINNDQSLTLYVQQLGIKYFIHVFLQELVDKAINIPTDVLHLSWVPKYH